MPGDVQFHSISFVSISDDVIARVARRTGQPLEEVYTYLKSDRQDDELLRAFLFFGIGPLNKKFAAPPSNDEPSNVSMGTSVPYRTG